MINKFKITCEQYQWPDTTALTGVNFFATDTTPQLTETINLKDYILDIGELEYSFDNSSDDSGQNILFFEDSDITFTCSGTWNKNYLKIFYKIFEDTTYIKYIIKIFDLNNNLLGKGIVNQEAIEEQFKIGNDNKEIKVQALGFLKELRNYLSNKQLLDPAKINWEYDTSGIRTYATGTINFSQQYGMVQDGDTLTIGTDIYTFKTSPRHGYHFDVQIANPQETILNTCINNYSSFVTGTSFPFGNSISIVSKIIGGIGNSYAFTTTSQEIKLTPTSGHLEGGMEMIFTSNYRLNFNTLIKSLVNNQSIFQIEDSLSDYICTRDPVLKKVDSENHNFTLLKTGYERIYQTNENIWGFIKKLCFSYGWICFYYNEIFYIKNRSELENSFNVIDLDYRKFDGDGFTASKAQSKIEYDSIVINDGQFYGGNNSGFGTIRRGNRFYIFTNGGQDAKNNIPFVGMSGLYGLHFSPNEWQKYYSEDSVCWTYQIVKDILENYYGADIYTLTKDTILFVDGGGTGVLGWQYDVSNGRQSACANINDDNLIHENDVAFNGNYGNCLYKILPDGKIQTYSDYATTDIFKNNFLKYLNQKQSRKLTIKYKGLIFNPLTLFRIVNAPNNDLDGIYGLNNLKIDFKEETTTLELQLQV